MKYPTKAANGDAGEFFFAYQIASVLKWPCRLLDIDIGVDAQVEVLNEDRSSTGRFVAFQIKATSKEETTCRYVSKKQLEYWRELKLPVFVALVDLSNQKMYLHLVDADRSYVATTGGNVRIDFDLEKDQFSADSAMLISESVTQAALSHVKRLLSIVDERVKEIRRAIADSREIPDPEELLDLMKTRSSFKEELAQAFAVADSHRVGKSYCKKSERVLKTTLQELRNFMVECNMHTNWNDKGLVTEFIEEGR